MARRFNPRSTPAENLLIIVRSVPWKLLVLLVILVIIAVPAFLYGTRFGSHLLPSLSGYIYKLTGPAPAAAPTPLPAYPGLLPQAGSIQYTIKEGDSCDSILTFQMRMNDAGQVFSDANPETVKALNAALGVDCHHIQPGAVLKLSPQYPLVTLGGVVLKIDATSPQQVLPTPLINIPQKPSSVDCSGGCLLTVRVAPQAQVRLLVQTTLTINVGSWVWAQALMARKSVAGFANYPYADPGASFNGMSLHACDLQVDNTHDDDSLSCDQISPNTIDDDGGSWLLGVTGPGGLDHWSYHLRVPSGTQVMVWLSAHGGSLKFQAGNPVYRYDAASQLYVKM
ncbi:hypothetical protein EPA93_22005 [Ktedonosporobacter rubrisoli]|uniref:Uncharacterized protein n=1 Tax=Ktedonosporobacter rubrisoli TaxID=2509675 RepID=A0A4V0YZ53_KTERU|nr:LysM peptidoglycan-binding domain-containing protein [Ktedonosporobacter rubrisoli]QBD78521.1 hypothetical protein EPA93_22005 [Ktedonosporobacter rubrisoli]